MSRKRTKKLTLVLLGSLGAAVSVSGCGRQTEIQKMAGSVDAATARKAAAAGASASILDGVALTASALTVGPLSGASAPLNLANLATIIDQADETLDVIASETGVPRSTSPQSSTTRARHHYHGGPGIGWFVWGYALARLSGSRYVPPPTYSPTPRPIVSGRVSNSPGSRGSGGTGFGRSAPIGGGSGGVSRGGFGSSGAAHSSGGT